MKRPGAARLTTAWASVRDSLWFLPGIMSLAAVVLSFLTLHLDRTWDTTQTTGQLNRLPVEVKIMLSGKGVRKDDEPFKYITKFMIPTTQALTFGIPR